MDARTEGIERGRPRDHGHPEPRRRPSGEPPALPHELGRSGKFFLLLVLYFVIVITAFLVFPSLESVFERWDHTRQLWVTDLRTPGLTRVMLVINGLTSSWTIRVIRWSVILALVVFRRWRHLFVFLGGCVTYRYRFGADAEATLALEADEAVTFGLRTVLVRQVRDELGLTLCGAGAPPCLNGD